MFEFLFGNKNTEKILIYLYFHEKTFGAELSRTFNS